MKRIQQYQRILSGRQTVPLFGYHPIDPLLRTLLVHAVYANKEMDEAERHIMALLMPELPLEEMSSWLEAAAREPLDVDAIRNALPNRSDRFELVQLVRSLVSIDQNIDQPEQELLDALNHALLDQP